MNDEVKDIQKEPEADYDRNQPQKIFLTVEIGTKIFYPNVTISSVSDDEFFALKKSVELNARRVNDISTELLKPYATLGREKLAGWEKFKPGQEPKDRELISAMQLYFDVTSEIETDEAAEEEFLDYDLETTVTMTFKNNGRETRRHISFRETSADDLDEYLAILADKPSKSALASASKEIKEKRLKKLALEIKTGSDYANDGIPVWHLIEACARFCNSELARLGKS